MKVADGVDDLGGGFADLVGGANGVAFVHIPAGEEDGHGVLIVIAPEAFAAAALRNAVTNIASMVFTSDIPDWCATEALGCDKGAGAAWPPAQDELRAMWEVSPMQVRMATHARTHTQPHMQWHTRTHFTCLCCAMQWP